MNYCFLNGLCSGVPQKYDKSGSLIVVHDLPGLVAQNGNGQLSVVAVRFFFSFASACGAACFLKGIFVWVPQKYDKLGSLIVVHDLPGLVTQNGNGQLSVVAVGFFFSFASACGTAPTKKKPAAMPTVNALINFDFIVSPSSLCAYGSVYPQERTFAVQQPMSAMGQWRTFDLWTYPTTKTAGALSESIELDQLLAACLWS
jgi:hypothetical protein